MVDLLYSVLITLIYAICSINAGLIFFRILRYFDISVFNKDQIFAEMTISFLLGLSFISHFWLFIGLFLNLNIYSIAIVITISLLFLILIWPKYLRFIDETIRIFKKMLSLGTEWKIIIIIIFIIMFLYGMLAVLLPPRCDAEAFYMVWPKIISYTGIIIPQPNYYGFSQIGISGELHFASLMTMAGPQSATFLVWIISLAIMGCVLLICSRLNISLYGKIIALVVVVTSTAYTTIIAYGNVNLFAVPYGLAAYYWIIVFLFKGQKRQLLLCGCFAGLAVVAKFSYLIVLIPGIALIIVLKYLYEGEKALHVVINTVRTGFIVSVTFLLALIPHFLKNHMLFNEPFAPFFYLSNPEALGWVNQVWYTPEITRHILLTYPIALSFGLYPMQGGNLSPLVLILLPLMVLTYHKAVTTISGKLSVHIAFIGLISLIIWMAIQPSILAPRYILATLFLLIFPVAKSADFVMLSSNLKMYKLITIAVLIWALLLISPKYSTLKVLGSIGEKTTGFESVYYDSCILLNNMIERDERLYLAGYYSYFLRPDILVNLNGDDDNAAIFQRTSLSDQFDQMIELGFAYILVQKASHGGVFDLVLEEGRLEFQNVVIVFEDDHAVIFKLKSQ